MITLTDDLQDDFYPSLSDPFSDLDSGWTLQGTNVVGISQYPTPHRSQDTAHIQWQSLLLDKWEHSTVATGMLDPAAVFLIEAETLLSQASEYLKSARNHLERARQVEEELRERISDLDHDVRDPVFLGRPKHVYEVSVEITGVGRSAPLLVAEDFEG